jgi:metal-sulfur cluster biosynthetic enzyme
MPTTLTTEGAERVRREVFEVLDTIVDPCSAASSSPMGLVSMGLVNDVAVSSDGVIAVDLRLTSPACLMVAYLATESRQRIAGIAGVNSVVVQHDDGFEWTPDHISPAEAERRRTALSLLPRTQGQQ